MSKEKTSPPKTSLRKKIVALLTPVITPVLTLGIILGLSYGFWKMGAHNPAAPTNKAKPDDQVGIRFFNVELLGKKSGTRFFSIFADQIEISKDNRYVFFQGKTKPHGEFYNLKDWDQELSAEVQAPNPTPRNIQWEAKRAEYDLQLENLTMYDKVRLITDAGDIVETDEMFWSKQDETLKSTTRSKVLTHKKTYFEADKLDVKTRDKEIVMEGKVYIEMNVGKDQKVEVPGQ
ncbi:hypothetical protein COW36_07960 [bacterium (Candidatus Blackallbacteria) CG17_big_fil_post_rev_8_21_14_2_50_48_46]|uniref:LPS export ABC transporter periplasmic protein LptC n=1 Tax=bacterium (Candidatus Blackallbacteria) CG17_big_fil_post_rev_8_21_14_2_50_48_46 TaxID=2014261 RepID=A0A2M7G7I2_9BACT|nr:MAG: hypothetical protein COW64_23055 [bacterium (Candidatus Blackallbacteria) CG18_big_fil_WC_8_21_14_2_50_49_26]PIW17669.1 MAG: hypothetical protein COW36_07960 [bacterium (Candidatus Blackallbacteria) CG17_big_fil_post_rev_8_21_14_2_50_48_46]PIW50112.1 MAG: hypothetical protein COW20_03650 [bacterium (Candidatus Blackallbacteria) CG13_big_fil_rev_8_21_14_2_50_49_14]